MSKQTSDTRATVMSLPIFLTLETQQIPVICVWLNVQELVLLDMAVSSYSVRKEWLIILKFIMCKAIDGWRHSHSSIRWAIKRGIPVTHVFVGLKHRDTVSDITFEAVDINVSPYLCEKVVRVDDSLTIWEGHKYLLSIDLSGCKGITVIGLSALGHGCDQLQTINLCGCQGITDAGLSALALGCGWLQIIDLSECQGITDIGLSALVHGCGQLQTINLCGCQGIEDIDLSVLGHGCGQLQIIDLSGCEGITDIGLSALGHGCGQLQTISIHGCLSNSAVYQPWAMDVVCYRESISIVVKVSQMKVYQHCN
jgi:Leucine Rich repeat